MKYSEAKKQIKALSNKYDIDMGWGNFEVVYNGKTNIILVSGICKYGLHITNTKALSKLPFSNKLYMILAERASTPLAERVEEKKHYIKIFDGSTGYLNIICEQHSPLGYGGQAFADSGDECFSVKTRFTDKEIEQLKKRDDIPLDWNKVHFEDAE